VWASLGADQAVLTGPCFLVCRQGWKWEQSSCYLSARFQRASFWRSHFQSRKRPTPTYVGANPRAYFLNISFLYVPATALGFICWIAMSS
jgi:hypothetical protein